MDKLTDRQMIRLGVSVLFVGILLVVLPVEKPIFSLFGFWIIGFGAGPVFPCVIHATPANFGNEYSGAIIGVQMASSYVGSTFAPTLFGLLSKVVGLQALPICLLVLVIAGLMFMDRTFHITRKRTP